MVLCTCQVVFALPLSYQFTNIGQSFSGDSFARGINNLGQVVGNYQDSNREDRAFLWDPKTGVQDLGPGIAKSINDRGEVIIKNGSTAYHWYKGTTTEMTSLGSHGEIYKINNRGQVVGDYEGDDYVMKGFIWQNGITTHIGSLAGPAGESNAISINDSGTVVGWSSSSDKLIHMIYWEDGSLYDAGYYYDSTRKQSLLTDINNDGLAVALVFDTSTPFVKYEGYWGYGKPPVYVGPVWAWALNDLGVVVGDTKGHGAFVWDIFDGQKSLKDMLETPYPYGLRSAYDINNYGQIVGTTGADAFLLTPIPEPTTSVSLLLGILFLKRSRCR